MLNLCKMTFFLCSLCAFSLSFTSLAHAFEAIGKITKKQGIVRIERADPATQNAHEDIIFLNDIVTTSVNSLAQISFIDETSITIAEDARLRIDDFVFDSKNKKDNKAKFSMIRGGFFYVSGLIAKKENPDVRINMPFGSIGVRGTEVWGGMLDKECRVYIENGEIVVFNDFGSTRLKHGQGVRLREASVAPSGAEVWKQPAIDWIKSRVVFDQ